MHMSKLTDRCYGYEFTSSEYNTLFKKEFENLGYVRFLGKRQDSFYLDPSPWARRSEETIYILKNCPVPPKDQLIEVNITETEEKINVVNDSPVKIKINYISNWKIVNPVRLISKDFLMNQEEFLNYYGLIFSKHNLDIDDMKYCMALYATSSPPLNDVEKGGINATVLANYSDRKKWTTFKKAEKIIPSEFRKISSTHYYQELETNFIPNPVESTEVNLAYYNVEDVPVIYLYHLIFMN